MPGYLLDTDICSYAIKRKQPELLSKIRAGLIHEEIAISAITRGELLYGLDPYLKPEELAPVVEAFDNLFGEIKTRETDKGTMLFSLSAPTDNRAEQIRLLADKMDVDRNDAEQMYNNGDRVDPETGDFRGGGGMGYSRRIHGKIYSPHDYVVPETPEFDGNMSGDLAYTPISAEDVGIEQLPIRLNVGVAVAPHRGYGIKHIEDNARRDKARGVPIYTADEQENYNRHVAMLARNFVEIYREDDALILRYKNEALVVRNKIDPVTQEQFYSVSTIRPAENIVWGDPVWAGREYFPDDRLQQPRASTLSPDQESLQSDRLPQRNQTSHYDGIQTNPDRQPKNKPAVTYKKHRKIAPNATTIKRAVLAFLDYVPCLEWPVAASDHYAKLRGTQKITGNHVGYMDTLIACHVRANRTVSNNEAANKIRSWRN